MTNTTPKLSCLY